MSLTKAPPTKRYAGGCGVSKALGALPPSDQDTLLKALADSTYSGAVLSRMLREEGVVVSDFTIRRHRRTDCACYRNAK